MNNTIRFVIPTALAMAAALGAGAVQARDADVQWSVTIGTPVYATHGPVYVQPQPVYVQPRPVYVQPRPVYYHQPAPVYYNQPVPVYRAPRHQGQARWDRDGDGIPNRYDRVYNPAWDRDGDGIPNRYDRNYSNVSWDRDGDGTPDRHDRYPRDGGRR